VSSPFVDVLASVARAFESTGLGWYVFGAQAAIIHGAARLTADVDVTVQLGGTQPEILVDALLAAGFALRVPDPNFIATTRVLPIVHAATQIPVDVVLGGPGLEELFLARAVVLDVGGVRVPVARAEDVIVMKLLAARAKDIDDVIAILAAHPQDLDLKLVRETVREVEAALDQNDLTPALDRALAAARGTPRRRSAPRKKRQH
jgi:hypothetical protein